jgi:serine/threonine protein kinase
VLRIGNEDNWDIQIRMERLKSLQAKMAEGPLSAEEAAKLGVDVCAALTACEQYSLIHRDIKPANIFVDRWGHYKLGDFGTARAQGSGSTMTQKAGTELYMAPEVMRGGHYDKRVDIYSLGLVLYQLTNGNRLPFYPAPEQITQRAMEAAWEKRQ